MNDPAPNPAANPQRVDLELAQRIVSGDGRALEELHALHSEPLYRFVYYRVDCVEEEAEEIVQETFLAALESLRRFRGDAALFTWLCGIAKNKIHRARRQRYRRRISAALDTVDPQIEDMLVRLDQEELPHEVLAREETQDLVGATLASLPHKYQEVLTDKYMASRPVNEIAAASGKSPKSIESTLTRARIAFKRAFEILTGNLAGGYQP